MNRFWGASSLVAGTTVGAGMLAFPLVTLKLGLLVSFVIMIACFIVMYVTAVLTAKVIMTHSKTPLALPIVAEKMGKTGAALLGHAVTVILFYSLMTAYIVGGASILKNFLPLPDSLVMITFALVLGGLIVGNPRHWDYANRLLFAGLVGVFATILLTLAPCCTLPESPMPLSEIGMIKILSSVPIFFTAFAFHGSIPVVMGIVGFNLKSLKKSFLVGSLIPLVIYLLWQYTAFTAFPAAQKALWVSSHDEGLGEFLRVLGSQAGVPALQSFTSVFGFLAIITSFIGVGLGLCAYLQDLAARKGGSVLSGVRLFWLAVGIPLGFAIIYPTGFLEALGFAALMLCILVIVLPVYLAWHQRTTKKHASIILYAGLLAFAIFLFAIELGRLFIIG